MSSRATRRLPLISILLIGSPSARSASDGGMRMVGPVGAAAVVGGAPRTSPPASIAADGAPASPPVGEPSDAGGGGGGRSGGARPGGAGPASPAAPASP